METTRDHVDERLAEINCETNTAVPSMAYWKALQRGSRRGQHLPDPPASCEPDPLI